MAVKMKQMWQLTKKEAIQRSRSKNLFFDVVNGKRIYYRFEMGIGYEKIKITEEDLRRFDNSTLYYHKMAVKNAILLGKIKSHSGYPEIEKE